MSTRPSMILKGKGRPLSTRKCKQSFLIVTEGEKTEPIYLQDLRRSRKISTVSIQICNSIYGTDPLSVVDYAIYLKKQNIMENRKTGEPKFDRIYCVIDRDDHDKIKYTSAFDKGKANGINMIRSIPCFELWYLLHFVKTTKLMYDRKKLSSELKKHLKGYEKNKSFYSILQPRIETALQNSEFLAAHQKSLCDIDRSHPNPLTEVHLLVKELLKIN